MEEKIYYPSEITDTPFPGKETESDLRITTDTGEVQQPPTTQSGSFPTPRIAVELLSSALDTRSKRILESFGFAKSGALQIGELLNGVSGDVRLSPNGIVARDSAGLVTFALDGTTGGAVFKGEVQAGTLISGTVVVGTNKIIIDGVNERIIINDGSNDRVILGKF